VWWSVPERAATEAQPGSMPGTPGACRDVPGSGNRAFLRQCSQPAARGRFPIPSFEPAVNMRVEILRSPCAPAAVALFLIVLLACSTGPGKSADSAPAADPVRSAPVEAVARLEPVEPAAESRAVEPAGRSCENLPLETEKKQRELYLAQLELDLARQQASSARAEAEAAELLARFAEKTAQDAIGHYRKLEAPQLLEREQLTIDRQQFVLESEQRDLAQLEAKLGPRVSGEKVKQTGGLALWRSRTAVEHADRELKLLQAGKQRTEEYEIPRRTGELVAYAKEQSDAHLRAEEAILQTDYRAKIETTRAENRVDLLTLELEELRARASDA